MAGLMIVLVGSLLTLLAPVFALAQSPADLDFQARCHGPGVLRCVDFDTTAWINYEQSTNRDWGKNYGLQFGGPLSNGSRTTIDTTVKASGAGSIKHVFPAGVTSVNDGVMDFVAHFTPCPGAGNNPTNCFANQYTNQNLQTGDQIFIQWRARYSPEMLVQSNWIDDNHGGLPIDDFGNKMGSLGLADLPTCRDGGAAPADSHNCPTMCSAQGMEVVMTGGKNIDMILAYSNCAGIEGFRGFSSVSGTGGWNYENQISTCDNNSGYTGCRKYVANEWLTFKVWFKMGTFNQYDSEFRFWMGRQGQPLELLVDCRANGPSRCDNDFSNKGQGPGGGGKTIRVNLTDENTGQPITGPYRVGKIHLTPYTTNAGHVIQTATVWYDELIISTQDIADPGASTGPVIRPMAPANLRVQ